MFYIRNKVVVVFVLLKIRDIFEIVSERPPLTSSRATGNASYCVVKSQIIRFIIIPYLLTRHLYCGNTNTYKLSSQDSGLQPNNISALGVLDKLLLIEIFITDIFHHCCLAVRSNDKGFLIYVSDLPDSGGLPGLWLDFGP